MAQRIPSPSSARDALQQGALNPRESMLSTPSGAVFPNTRDVWTTPIKNNPATPNPDVPGIGDAENPLPPNPNPPYTGSEPATVPGPLTGPQEDVHGVDAPEGLRVPRSEPWGAPAPEPPAETGGM